ncbi:MAG: hypothetical protein GY918_13005 [Gammaproteobacteria bacterium]|nr:hypothetical protein [Gammaproteobacteria bacterium]
MRKILLTLLLLFPMVSQAAPWCLVIDENERCQFRSADACYAAASKRGGSCRENYKILGSKGNYPWCLVTSQYRSCIYWSQDDCLRDARSENGGCVDNFDLAIEKTLALNRRNQTVEISCAEGDVICETASSAFEPQMQEDQVEVVIEDSFDENSLDNF